MKTRLRILVLAFVCLALGAFLAPVSSQTMGQALFKSQEVVALRQVQIAAMVQNEPPVERTPAKAHDIALLLKQPIETKGLREKIKLKEALEYIKGKFDGKLMILVEKDAFTEELGADAPDPDEQEVSLPLFPSKMSLSMALRLIVGQVGGGKATYMIRDGWIEITTTEASSSAHMLSKKVGFFLFEKLPLQEVCQELSAASGLTININKQIVDKNATPVTVTLPNSTLQEALEVVTESANLKFVVYPSSIFITTPQHAKELEKEVKN